MVSRQSRTYCGKAWSTIAQVRAAVQKLKRINWLYANIDDGSVDDASQRIVESVSDTTSTMLVKVTADDVKSVQSYKTTGPKTVKPY